jgi:hypothetical protein
MKYFFRRKIPLAKDVLFIESGSPGVVSKALPRIRNIFPAARCHLCTCWPDAPGPGFTSVFRATDYPSTWNKLNLLLSFRRKRWEVLAVLCTGEPFLWRWKVLAILLLPAKVLIVNENADFFWLDWDNQSRLRRFLGIRWGVNREEFFSTLGRVLVFPGTLLILLSTALFLYARRWRRLAYRTAQDFLRGGQRRARPAEVLGDQQSHREPTTPVPADERNARMVR